MRAIEAFVTLHARILIVDDEDEARFSLPLPLEDAGAQVVTAADGQAALEEIRAAGQARQPYDLMILDIAMPRLTGIELLDELARQDITLPCIAISGYGDKHTLIELLRRGVDDFLDKPFAADQLLAMVEMVLSKQAPLSLGSSDFRQTVTPGGVADRVDGTTWRFQRGDRAAVLRLGEGAQAADAGAIRDQLLGAFDAGLRTFTCDCTGNEGLDAVVLSVILRFSDMLAEVQAPRLLFEGLSDDQRHFFRVINLCDQFHIELGDLL